MKEENREAVGYQSDGEAISQSGLIVRAEASNKSIKEGRTKDIQQLRKEAKSW